MSKPQLDQDQLNIIADIKKLVAAGQQRIVVAGMAGTGKTLLLSYLANDPQFMQAPVLAPTNKAANVLRTKGVQRANTVHSVFYRPKESKASEKEVDALLGKLRTTGKLSADERKLLEPEYYSQDTVLPLTIVDECSMVDERMDREISKGSRTVIYFGDHGQLPPVQKYNGQTFSVFQGVVNHELKKIYRNGGNILEFCHNLRYTGNPWNFSARKVQDLHVSGRGSLTVQDTDRLMAADAIICWKNKTVHYYNTMKRLRLGFYDNKPYVGDLVMFDWSQPDNYLDYLKSKFGHCTQYQQFFNVMPKYSNVQGDLSAVTVTKGDRGTILEVIEIVDHTAHVVVEIDNGLAKFHVRVGIDLDYLANPDGRVLPMTTKKESGNSSSPSNLFRIPVKFGHAITCHKAQGSEFNTVAVVDEMPRMMAEYKPWAYTAASRAKSMLHWFG